MKRCSTRWGSRHAPRLVNTTHTLCECASWQTETKPWLSPSTCSTFRRLPRLPSASPLITSPPAPATLFVVGRSLSSSVLPGTKCPVAPESSTRFCWVSCALRARCGVSPWLDTTRRTNATWLSLPPGAPRPGACLYFG